MAKTTKAQKITIVLAWVDDTGMVATGRMVRRDGVNYFPEFKSAPEAKAAVWLRRGTTQDIAKAEAFAKSEGRKVYTFPTSERDPLGKARNRALLEAR